MKPLVYHRNTCRLCDSPNVELVLPLAPCPPVDAYITESQLQDAQEVFPIDLYLCHECGHAQLLDIVSPDILFGDYIYTTSSSPGLVDYFHAYSSSVCEQLRPNEGALALDIGSNDGTLLSFFKKKGLTVLGVDPAQEIARDATARGIETIPAFFTSELAGQIRQERGPASILTANNVFAHSDDLGDMAKGIRLLLATDGVFVFEVSYLLDMIQGMVFDFIYHEHLSHHSVKPLKRFLLRHGLHLFAVERTPSKGGSIRCFAQLTNGPRAESATVSELLHLEEDFGLYRTETYQAYAAGIAAAKDQTLQLLKQLKSEGKNIAGYGASATATVLIYHFQLGGMIDFIIDDNPHRQGRFSPGHHLPIKSSEALVNKEVDYVIVLAWRFAEMIVKRNQEYLGKGGHFIIPLPQLQII